MELYFIYWLLHICSRSSSFLDKSLIRFREKEKAEQNPWGEGATTLEWTVSSPPPFHTFEELPKVK